MSALSAAGRDDARTGTTIHVRVTDPPRAAELVGYFDRLGLRALAGPNGSIAIRLWDDVEWAEARLEIAMAIDSWVRHHGVPVQLS